MRTGRLRNKVTLIFQRDISRIWQRPEESVLTASQHLKSAQFSHVFGIQSERSNCGAADLLPPQLHCSDQGRDLGFPRHEVVIFTIFVSTPKRLGDSFLIALECIDRGILVVLGYLHHPILNILARQHRAGPGFSIFRGVPP